MGEQEGVVAELDGALVRYTTQAVGPVDLKIRDGEIVALIGASGSGKSTALRLLAGLETATEGRVRRDLRPGRTAMVFQAPTLMPWADSLANVALPLELLGRSSAVARDKAAAALAGVGLGDRMGERPRHLSGGMAMRVSLARALVTDPDLLLLDEPFAALDTVTRRKLISDLHLLWAQRRPAMVFVTHDVEEAVFLAARVVVLDRAGRAVWEGPTPGALPRPAGWRTDPAFLDTVESTVTAMETTVSPRKASA